MRGALVKEAVVDGQAGRQAGSTEGGVATRDCCNILPCNSFTTDSEDESGTANSRVEVAHSTTGRYKNNLLRPHSLKIEVGMKPPSHRSQMGIHDTGLGTRYHRNTTTARTNRRTPY